METNLNFDNDGDHINDELGRDSELIVLVILVHFLIRTILAISKV